MWVPGETATRLPEIAACTQLNDFVVINEAGEYTGMVLGSDIRTSLIQHEALPLMIIEELMRTELPSLQPEDTLEHALAQFDQKEVTSLPVLDNKRQVVGVLTHKRLLERYRMELEQRG